MTRRVMLVLAFVGLAIAAYLSYTRVTSTTAICPTGGDGCETVQSSPRLRLAGVYIPYLALAGYAGMVVAILARRMLVAAGIAWFGVAMTGYVTYLQAFVIKAWCPWCVLSTAIMWALALLASREYLRGAPHPPRALPPPTLRARTR